MPEVKFEHGIAGGPPPLVVSTGPNQIVWGYGLNTVTIPTYGGEVVQILSVYIDDMTITGTCKHYKQMERIYEWFVSVLQMMTQGQTGTSPFQNYIQEDQKDYGRAYNQTPVVMNYPERGWTFEILPKALPGFRYARDNIAPEFQIQAAVVQADADVIKLTAEDAEMVAFGGGNLDEAFEVSAEIGYEAENRFSAPYKGEFNPEKTRKALGENADYFNKLIPNYLDGDFKTLSADMSKPAFGNYGINNQDKNTDNDGPASRDG